MNFNTDLDAYWISPDKKVFGVSITHISFVIDNPELFSLTKEKILKVYKKYDEPLGLEGQARSEIMKELILKGWIRIRKSRNFWTAQMKEWNYENRIIMKNFTLLMIESGLSKWTELKISITQDIIIKLFNDL